MPRAAIRGVAITDAHSGETLARHPTCPDEISVADRGYAHHRGIGAVVTRGTASFLHQALVFLDDYWILPRVFEAT